MKTRPWASCSGMGGSTTSFGGASFWTATRGVAPLTSFAVCAAAECAQMAIAIAITATRPTVPVTFGLFTAGIIQDLLHVAGRDFASPGRRLATDARALP